MTAARDDRPGPPRDPIAEVRRRLAGRPALRSEEGPGSITLFAPGPDGFDVGLAEDPAGGWVVSWGDGWHEHLPDPGDALEWFARGLSKEFRLREDHYGRRAWRWTAETRVESDDGGEAWRPVSQTGLPVYPFWRRRRAVYRRNRVL